MNHSSDPAAATVLHGIPNCDTVKKARAWLAGQGVAYRFHDFRRDGVPPAELERWIRTLGVERLVNRKGTTWRGLDSTTQAAAADADGARRLMLAHPGVIKRPVMQWADGALTVGFDAGLWAAHLATHAATARPPGDKPR